MNIGKWFKKRKRRVREEYADQFTLQPLVDHDEYRYGLMERAFALQLADRYVLPNGPFSVTPPDSPILATRQYIVALRHKGLPEIDVWRVWHSELDEVMGVPAFGSEFTDDGYAFARELDAWLDQLEANVIAAEEAKANRELSAIKAYKRMLGSDG